MMQQKVGGTDLLRLAERKMHWLQNRQSVLAGNIANATTPNYVPKDVSSFHGVLSSHQEVTLAQTEPGHMAGHGGQSGSHNVGGPSSIDGNHVVLENELEKIADTNDQHRLATAAYSRYMGMFGTVLGSSSQ
ncbi:flagellar biosynthesis protein FlgB [Acetobacter malorum]|nr:flagellar biosynthesis protein FlgB [Acetobacter malorum]